MRDARALRETRRSAARGMHLLAVAGIALTLVVTATAIIFTHPGSSAKTDAASEISLSKQSSS